MGMHDRERSPDDAMELLDELCAYVRLGGRKLTRNEMNERCGSSTRADSVRTSIRDLQTRVRTGGRKLTREELYER